MQKEKKKKKIKFDGVIRENSEKHNSNWQITDHSYRILIIINSVSGKTITLLDLLNR